MDDQLNLAQGGIVDAHVHMFPPEIYKNWEKYADRDDWFKKLTREPEGDRGTKEAWSDDTETLACMAQAGVDEIIMQGWYFNDPGLIRLHNDYMAELIRKYPGKMHGFIATNPKFKDQALYEIERCKALGFEGIGELGPGGNGYDFKDEDFIEILRCAKREALPICIHCGEAVSHDYPGKDLTPLGPLAEAIRQFPEVQFILAHLGGGMPFFEMARRYCGRFDQVYYDLAAVPLIYRIDVLRQVVSMVGRDRMLFGSDFPLLLYPSKNRERDMTMWIQDIIQNSHLDPESMEAVFKRNARKLLNHN